MNVLVTGGAGYIGSHACLRLLNDGHAVSVLDNFVNGHQQAIDVLQGLAEPGRLTFCEGDLRERDKVAALLEDRSIEVVMHFAALAEVGQSMGDPLLYHDNNFVGSLSLLQAMDRVGVRRLVFSSTCATYGEPDQTQIPIRETCPQRPINPYGASKLHVERLLADYAGSVPEFAYAALRYFNVAGSDPEGRIGEDHRPESHLIPICLQAALGKRDRMSIFGTDYPTPDGTCIRDYVHVVDLVDAHVHAMHALEPGDQRHYNIGIGKGHSVRECIDTAREVTGVDFEVVEAPRRPGDPPTLFACCDRIQEELGWTARYTDLTETVSTAWNWFSAHPNGYED
ncbi:MAG: UDP-glucose 4-epimerase GalE [Phycisphaerae bacterium]|nr:UDP-glucose 4-epimerase GalE [Phycisphaerae bacterium]